MQKSFTTSLIGLILIVVSVFIGFWDLFHLGLPALESSSMLGIFPRIFPIVFATIFLFILPLLIDKHRGIILGTIWLCIALGIMSIYSIWLFPRLEHILCMSLLLLLSCITAILLTQLYSSSIKTSN